MATDVPGRLFVLLQLLLPRYALTRLVHWIARIRWRSLKDALIRAFARLYSVDLDEAAGRTPLDYPSLNAFFTRELAAGMRPVDPEADAIVSPVDGYVSAAGPIEQNTLFQAKGLTYTLEDLLAVDLDEARAYRNGQFATLYLAPHNYHRVHMPLDGELVAAHYVPGDLFSVNSATVYRLRGLFHRNERLNLHFRTAFGPMAVLLVGALNVGSITTPWTGEIRPTRRGVVEALAPGDAERRLRKGDLLGWFNMGSTVLVLLPTRCVAWDAGLAPDAAVRMGTRIGRVLPRQ
jgi:phosphatidylserine decarboxylase